MIPSLMGTVAGLIPRYWKLALIGVLLAVIGVLKLSLASEQRHAANLRLQVSETSASFDRFKAEVAAQTALAKAQDEAHARGVEREQIHINQETVSAYQKEIAALRLRAAQRLRDRAPTTNSGRGATAPMSGFSEAANRIDGASGEDGLPAADGLIASEIAVRLKALQDWVKEQEQVER